MIHTGLHCVCLRQNEEISDVHCSSCLLRPGPSGPTKSSELLLSSPSLCKHLRKQPDGRSWAEWEPLAHSPLTVTSEARTELCGPLSVWGGGSRKAIKSFMGTFFWESAVCRAENLAWSLGSHRALPWLREVGNKWANKWLRKLQMVVRYYVEG